MESGNREETKAGIKQTAMLYDEAIMKDYESLAASTLEKFRLAQTHDHEGNDSQKDPAVNPRYVEGELKAAQRPGASTQNVVTRSVMRQIQENKELEFRHEQECEADGSVRGVKNKKRIRRLSGRP